jgi:hypothetical protein
MPRRRSRTPRSPRWASSEHEAKAKGLDITVGKFPFAASGRAMAVMETDGFVKVIAERVGPDKKDYKVIGVHIVGPEASDLISEGALALEMDAFVEDIGLTIHPHPTLGETVMEAAKAVHRRGRAHPQPRLRAPSGMRRCARRSAGRTRSGCGCCSSRTSG